MGNIKAEGKASGVRKLKSPIGHVNFEMPNEGVHQSISDTKDELPARETYADKAWSLRAKLIEQFQDGTSFVNGSVWRWVDFSRGNVVSGTYVSVAYCLVFRTSCTDGKLPFIDFARLKQVLVVTCGQGTSSPFLRRWEHFNVMLLTHLSERVS